MFTREIKNKFVTYRGYISLAPTALIVWILKIPQEEASRSLWSGEWQCYAAGVPGTDHEREMRGVLLYGEAVEIGLAEYLFGGIISSLCKNENHDYEKLIYTS